MAKKKKAAGKKKKKAAKKRPAPRRAVRKAAAKKKPVKKKAAKKKAARKQAAKRVPAPPAVRDGMVTHTELASADPLATKEWCQKVLGWKFIESVPTPAGPYHMWQFDNRTGGGIRANNPPETPGSIPYCEVKDIRATFDRAVMAGATVMMPPEQLPGGMGWIAIVAVPGGVPIGFWAAG